MLNVAFGRARCANGHRGQRLALTLSLAALLGLLLVPATALAHERRTIANGKYEVVVGWDTEPAYEGLKNGASLRLSRVNTQPTQPVEGAEKTLQVQVRQGAETRSFPLRAVFGQPGAYVADLVPMRAGDYQWTFTGSIGDDQINEVFDTADKKFNAVEALAGVQFPSAAVANPARDAENAARAAQTLASVGVVLGAIGTLAALALWLTRPRLTRS